MRFIRVRGRVIPIREKGEKQKRVAAGVGAVAAVAVLRKVDAADTWGIKAFTRYVGRLGDKSPEYAEIIRETTPAIPKSYAAHDYIQAFKSKYAAQLEKAGNPKIRYSMTSEYNITRNEINLQRPDTAGALHELGHATQRRGRSIGRLLDHARGRILDSQIRSVDAWRTVRDHINIGEGVRLRDGANFVRHFAALKAKSFAGSMVAVAHETDAWVRAVKYARKVEGGRVALRVFHHAIPSVGTYAVRAASNLGKVGLVVGAAYLAKRAIWGK